MKEAIQFLWVMIYILVPLPSYAEEQTPIKSTGGGEVMNHYSQDGLSFLYPANITIEREQFRHKIRVRLINVFDEQGLWFFKQSYMDIELIKEIGAITFKRITKDQIYYDPHHPAHEALNADILRYGEHPLFPGSWEMLVSGERRLLHKITLEPRATLSLRSWRIAVPFSVHGIFAEIHVVEDIEIDNIETLWRPIIESLKFDEAAVAYAMFPLD